MKRSAFANSTARTVAVKQRAAPQSGVAVGIFGAVVGIHASLTLAALAFLGVALHLRG